VPKLRIFIKYWLPVLIWMVVIYSASSDTKSFEHSSRILGPLFHWLFPHMSEKGVSALVFLVRKCAHLTEYAVLGLLVLRAVRQPVRNDKRPWRWSQAGFAVLVVGIYAASDEIHQLFVPHREGRIADVMIDTSGAVIGILLLWTVGRLSKQW
jgi:VanZ family protein